MDNIELLLEKQLKANDYHKKSIEMNKEVYDALLKLIGLKFKSKHSKLLLDFEYEEFADCEITGYSEAMKKFQVKANIGYSYLSHTDLLVALSEAKIFSSYKDRLGYVLEDKNFYICGYEGNKVLFQNKNEGVEYTKKYKLYDDTIGTYFNFKGKKIYVFYMKFEYEVVSRKSEIVQQMIESSKGISVSISIGEYEQLQGVENLRNGFYLVKGTKQIVEKYYGTLNVFYIEGEYSFTSELRISL